MKNYKQRLLYGMRQRISEMGRKVPGLRRLEQHVERPAEEKRAEAPAAHRGGSAASFGPRKAKPITELTTAGELRFPTGMGELDSCTGRRRGKRVAVLVGGAPGIGKSTLMLQICAQLCSTGDVLYVSGEESEHQLKMRAERLQVANPNLYVLSETNLADILDAVHDLQPSVLIIDSIQTMCNDTLDTPPGSIGQVKDCTMALMQLAKGEGVTVFVIGHVNKEGSIAGPKVLEHMVTVCCILKATNT